MVVEGRYDVCGLAAAKDFHIREHMIGPRRRLLLLSASGRISRWQTSMDPLDFAKIAVEVHDGEKSMSYGLTGEVLNCATDRERLTRRA